MNPPTQIPRLGDDELGRLDELLRATNADDSMVPEELDGFFAALACSPQPVPQSEYLPVVLGRENAEPVLDEARHDEMLALIQRHWNSVAGQLYEGEGFAPVFGEDDDGRVTANAWAIGFVRGMDLRPDAWDALDDDDEFADALEPVFRFVAESEGFDEDGEPAEPIADDERDELIGAMIDGVMDVYDYFRDEREKNLAPKTIRRDEPKVGRNDPCPCGSGRKYKACHGADRSGG